jgi:hypothetical protein
MNGRPGQLITSQPSPALSRARTRPAETAITHQRSRASQQRSPLPPQDVHVTQVNGS